MKERILSHLHPLLPSLPHAMQKHKMSVSLPITECNVKHHRLWVNREQGWSLVGGGRHSAAVGKARHGRRPPSLPSHQPPQSQTCLQHKKRRTEGEGGSEKDMATEQAYNEGGKDKWHGCHMANKGRQGKVAQEKLVEGSAFALCRPLCSTQNTMYTNARKRAKERINNTTIIIKIMQGKAKRKRRKSMRIFTSFAARRNGLYI